MSYIKLGLYVAAGVGTYEILRRTGLLQKAGAWLSEQVPDEYKDQAREYSQQLRDKAHEYTEQARGKASDVGSQLRDRARQYGQKAQDAVDSATSAVKQAAGYGEQAQPAGATTTGGQNLTGPGRGSDASTDDSNGAHASHRVGRGVVS